MTTADVIEDLPVHLHGLFCDCPPCRGQRGLKVTDPNDEYGFTTSDDGLDGEPW